METEYRGLERTGLDKTGQDMRDLPLKSCLYVEMLSVRFPASGMAENEVIPLQGSEGWFLASSTFQSNLLSTDTVMQVHAWLLLIFAFLLGWFILGIVLLWSADSSYDLFHV